jgi:hypothetical protein
VPRFYLRAFHSADKRIHIYNLERALAIENASLKDQCYRPRFYGKQNDLEDALGELEGHAAAAIKRMIGSRSAPQPGSEDHGALVMFVALQDARTAAAMTRTQLALNSMADAAFEGKPPPDYQTSEEQALMFSLGSLRLRIEALSDLRIHAILAPEGHAFITSDHPVARYNQYCYGVKGVGVLGAACRGLQVFLPLAPTVSALLFDMGVYKVGRRGTAHASVATPADVLVLNQLAYLAAQENLYFANWRERDSVDRLVKTVSRDARSQMRVTEAVEVGNDASVLLHGYEDQPAIDFRLSFVSLRREAKRVDPFERVRQYRKPLRLPEPPPPPRWADGRKHIFRVKGR